MDGIVYKKTNSGYKTVISNFDLAKEIIKKNHNGLGHRNLKDTIHHPAEQYENSVSSSNFPKIVNGIF